jgi:hypothetical protein
MVTREGKEAMNLSEGIAALVPVIMAVLSQF